MLATDKIRCEVHYSLSSLQSISTIIPPPSTKQTMVSTLTSTKKNIKKDKKAATLLLILLFLGVFHLWPDYQVLRSTFNANSSTDGYNESALKQFKHAIPKQNFSAPSRMAPSDYGAKVQLVKEDTSPHLLSQPFYIYEDILRDPTIYNFTNMCIAAFGATICTEVNNVTTFEELFFLIKDTKQGGDYHFVRSALIHPMRTTNQEDAKLFVVPFLFRLLAKVYFYDKSGRATTDRIFRDFDNRLNASKYFQRHDGKDHILYHASGQLGIWDKNQKFLNALNKCNLIQFYEGGGRFVHRPGYESKRFHFASQYVNGPPCDEGTCVNHLNPDGMKDIVFVGALNRPKGKNTNHLLRVRRKACAWIKVSSANFTYDTCGEGARCPAICGAKLGLHFRGDTWGANRIVDYFSVGTIPIVHAWQQYEAMPSFVNYSQLTYFVEANDRSHFESSLQRILRNKTDLELKRQNILKNRDLFVWETGVPFDVYMVSFFNFNLGVPARHSRHTHKYEYFLL